MWTEADKNYFEIQNLNIGIHFIHKYHNPPKKHILERLKGYQKVDKIANLRILRLFDPRKKNRLFGSKEHRKNYFSIKELDINNHC